MFLPWVRLKSHLWRPWPFGPSTWDSSLFVYKGHPNVFWVPYSRAPSTHFDLRKRQFSGMHQVKFTSITFRRKVQSFQQRFEEKRQNFAKKEVLLAFLQMKRNSLVVEIWLQRWNHYSNKCLFWGLREILLFGRVQKIEEITLGTFFI